MKNQPKIIEFNLGAREINRKVAPDKSIVSWGFQEHIRLIRSLLQQLIYKHK